MCLALHRSGLGLASCGSAPCWLDHEVTNHKVNIQRWRSSDHHKQDRRVRDRSVELIAGRPPEDNFDHANAWYRGASNFMNRHVLTHARVCALAWARAYAWSRKETGWSSSKRRDNRMRPVWSFLHKARALFMELTRSRVEHSKTGLIGCLPASAVSFGNRTHRQVSLQSRLQHNWVATADPLTTYVTPVVLDRTGPRLVRRVVLCRVVSRILKLDYDYGLEHLEPSWATSVASSWSISGAQCKLEGPVHSCKPPQPCAHHRQPYPCTRWLKWIQLEA